MKTATTSDIMSSYTKRKDANTTGSARPLMPRLAASAQATRSSPAPKLAGYTPPASQARRSPAHTTPKLQTTRSFPEDKVTPVTHFVNSNITPRSSSRNSRADSSQSTPVNDSDTPSRSKPTSTLAVDSSNHKSGPETAERSESDLNRRKSQYGNTASKQQSLPTSPTLAQSPERIGDISAVSEQRAYFFRADDGPSQESRPSRPQHKKTASFVYANGTSEAEKTQQAGLAENASSFSHASPRIQNALPTKTASRPTSMPSVQNGIRHPSPPRPGFHLTYRKGASQIIPPQPLSPSMPSVSAFDSSSRRKSSIDDDDDRRQSRTFSVSSFGSASAEYASRKDSGFPFLPMFSMPSSKNSPVVSPTVDGADRSSTTRDSAPFLSNGMERTQSPPSAVGSSESDPYRAEAAAHARRERKIMDLEISNSSLLVINRSLEKEIRRQKMELRRYKRLSRKSSLFSEDLSQASTGRMSSSADEEEDLDVPDEEDEELSSDSFAEEPMSPGAIAQRDARHRKSDQLRLQKDLAKHKELLADSKQMNQSLQKCLSVTEQLIQEGNKALEYKVNQEDIQLGGRVLDPEEQIGELSSRAPTPFDDNELLREQFSTLDSLAAQLESPQIHINGTTPETETDDL